MNTHKKFFTKIGLNYLILAILGIILQIILTNGLNIIKPEYLYDMNILTVTSALYNYILPLPIFYWLMKKLPKAKLEKSDVNVKTFIKYVAVTLTLMWMGNIIGILITMFLSGAMQSDIVNPVHELINSTSIWVNLVIVSIMGPIFEELFFRKLLIDRTIKYGAKVSIILSAVLFAFFHGNLNQFFYALFLGGFLSYVYIRTGEITYPIILHAIVNFMGSVVSIFIAQSAYNLQTGMTIADLSIIIVYFGFLFIAFLIGIYGLTQLKKARFRGSKTQIPLKNPYKTMFLNIGMVAFIVFFIIIMVRQVLG